MNDKPWTDADIPDQTGRTAIITGANSGIGFETARWLAKRGAHVVLAVRDENKGRDAAARISAEQPGAAPEVRRLDLADLDSVREFADGYLADGGAIDLLVNNGGVMAVPRRLTRQGHERQFATNHLGHFALTGLLLKRIEAGTDPRVVTVGSLAHRRGTIHFEDLRGDHAYGAVDFYNQSKLANLLFGFELDRRLRSAGSPVRSLVSHPGLSATSLVDNGFNTFSRPIARVVASFVTQSSEDGAMTTLYAATEPGAEGGQFIGPSGRRQYQGPPVVVRPAKRAEDRRAARRLWEVSEELTKVAFDLATVT